MTTDIRIECVECGGEGKRNTPYMTEQGIICYQCAEYWDECIQGVDQNSLVPVPKWSGKGVIVDDTSDRRCAWIDGGSIAVGLTDDQRDMDPEDLWESLVKKWSAGVTQCSKCGKNVMVGAGHKFGYAGYACDDCEPDLTKHERKAPTH